MRQILLYFIMVLFLATFTSVIPKSYAQSNESSGIAVYVQISDGQVQEGDIVALSKKGYVLTRAPYDSNMFGVVVKNPAIAFEDGQADSYPVVSAGKVVMRVSTMNGAIKKGDLLTSSTMAGVGQKATETGFIIASALEDYDSPSPKNAGKILVVLNVGHGNVSTNVIGNLFTAFKFVLSAPYMSPNALVRYIFAGFMVILSFLVAVGYFGRISSLGIEALGRNPLAGKMITFSIVLHILLSLVIVGVGITVAYLALVL